MHENAKLWHLYNNQSINYKEYTDKEYRMTFIRFNRFHRAIHFAVIYNFMSYPHKVATLMSKKIIAFNF